MDPLSTSTTTSHQETISPPRSPSLEVNTASAHQQLPSPLFRLPAELRQQIYEYVFGTGQIHIILRSCKSDENPIFRIDTITTTTQHSPAELSRLPNNHPSPNQEMHTDYQKLTYSTCLNPTSFARRYTLSKTIPSHIPVMYHNSQGRLPHFTPPEMQETTFPAWGMEHGTCYSAPQKDMVQQRFGSVRCSGFNEYRPHNAGRCEKCLRAQLDAEALYGPPTATRGLKKFHEGSAVCVDGLLRSCRKVYGEARDLPFKLYSFDIEAIYLRDMLTRWLEPWQAASIEKLHLTATRDSLNKIREGFVPSPREWLDGSWKEGVGLLMPKLKVWELEIEDEGLRAGDIVGGGPGGEAYAWMLRGERVSCIVGCDRGVAGRGREARRELAEVMEVIMGSDGRS